MVERCSELLVILKWGGDLTKLGERQAERLGNKFTKAMYPDPTYVHMEDSTSTTTTTWCSCP